MATIPNLQDIVTTTQVGKQNKIVESTNIKREIAARWDNECSTNILKAAQNGQDWCKCHPWMSSEYVKTLEKSGYTTKFVDTFDNGEGGRLHSFDVIEDPYVKVCWKN
jgi:hypothetical protein